MKMQPASAPRFTITRVTDTRYSVTSDVLLSDLTYQKDSDMRLDAGALRSNNRPGHIRVGSTLRINLGPKSLAAVSALTIGETVTL